MINLKYLQRCACSHMRKMSGKCQDVLQFVKVKHGNNNFKEQKMERYNIYSVTFHEALEGVRNLLGRNIEQDEFLYRFQEHSFKAFN